jgi:hypothetical protein
MPGRDSYGPDICADADGPYVHFEVRRLLHHVPRTLPAVYFRFASEQDVRSFSVNVRITAANMRQPETRTLHIQVVPLTHVNAPAPPEDE